MNDSAAELILPILSGASLLVCSLTAIFVLVLKLHRIILYRLALYQVLASICFAAVNVLQLLFVNYSENPLVYAKVCTAIGFLAFYAQWMKLLFNMWLIIHIFGLGVLQKNMKRFEVLYVVTSILLPALVAAVPLTTHSYGLNSRQTSCYIFGDQIAGVIERLALWTVPAMVILLAGSSAMAFMVVKLSCQVFRMSKYEPIVADDQFSKAIKQLLPLTAYPISFFVFVTPLLVNDIYHYHHPPPRALSIVVYLSVSLWTMTSGFTMLIHVAVVKLNQRRKAMHRLRIQYII